jgi:catechol 2,3-dioxygenase-like lactoylglutathione lyase family enzyme
VSKPTDASPRPRQWRHHRLYRRDGRGGRRFHATGIAQGGTTCEEPPGIREMNGMKLYLAYLRDPDGNKLCALHRAVTGRRSGLSHDVPAKVRRTTHESLFEYN